MELRVLVDTDPGLGLKYTDVDDGLALFLMLNNPEFELEGITTVFGNSPVRKGYPLVKKYLKMAKREDIPAKLGASSKNELGHLNGASRFLIEKVRENPNELTLLTLGPFTNIATALLHYPSFFEDLKNIVIMGGTLTPVTVFNSVFNSIDRRFFDKIPYREIVAEFNCYKDPLATKKVIEAETKTPRIEMGLEICCRTVITDKHVKKLEAVEKPIPQFIARHVKFWLRMWKLITGRGGFFPFDTCVPIYLLAPEIYKSIELFLEVDVKKLPGKFSIARAKNSAPITYCVDFQEDGGRERFLDLLISNLIR